MNYQDAVLPNNVLKLRKTAVMTEKTVPAGLLTSHTTEENQFGVLIVESGALQFSYDDGESVYDADQQHPIIIEPGKTHSLKLNGPVEFFVEFYEIDDEDSIPTIKIK